MALTKKQENEIYWKMYKVMTANREYQQISPYNMRENGLCYAHIQSEGYTLEDVCDGTVKKEFAKLSALQLFNPNHWYAYWYNDSESENYQSRLFALAMAIAMTEE